MKVDASSVNSGLIALGWNLTVQTSQIAQVVVSLLSDIFICQISAAAFFHPAYRCCSARWASEAGTFFISCEGAGEIWWRVAPVAKVRCCLAGLRQISDTTVVNHACNRSSRLELRHMVLSISERLFGSLWDFPH